MKDRRVPLGASGQVQWVVWTVGRTKGTSPDGMWRTRDKGEWRDKDDVNENAVEKRDASDEKQEKRDGTKRETQILRPLCLGLRLTPGSWGERKVNRFRDRCRAI